MKLAILMWCDNPDRGKGTIERVSTTGKDCVKFFFEQLVAGGYHKFTACENGQLPIIREDLREPFEKMITKSQELQEIVQRYLDEDELGVIYIRGEHSRKEDDEELGYFWWKIMIRNLH